MVKLVNTSLPIKFEQMKNVLDDRFMTVKIWIAHVGENRNNSIFSKQVLESMIPSLANTPILGYLTSTEEIGTDFAGHEERLVIEGGEFHIKYVGHAYGVIPEANNARFETKYGEDGIEREYLVVDGVLWNKFKEVSEIFDRDGGLKSQSMELSPSSIKGYVDDEGLFVFTQAKFEGACILGEGVTPAMVSSTVERFSVANNVKSEMKELLAEFNSNFSANNNSEGGVTLTKLNTNPDFATKDEEEKKKLEAEKAKAKTKAPEASDDEEAKAKAKEEEEKDKKKFADKDEDEKEKEAKKASKSDESEDEEEDEKKKFASDDEEDEDEKKSKADKSKEDEEKKKFETVKTELAELQAKYQTLTAERDELRTFKANVELAEKKDKLASYASALSKDEFEAIEANLATFSMVEIEKEIGFMLLKKDKFSANTQETRNRVHATNTDANQPYGSLSTFFTK
ncbi:hypothetical protein ACQKIY_25820 [Bacillus mycoides]|uniref:hypothetical protein n=1 Tax=Bacillus mycoides TaxID=1405 RepID=UPI003D00EECF